MVSTRLRTLIASPDAVEQVACEAVQAVGAAVKAIRGLRGLAVRAGFDTICKVRPGFLERQVEDLLPQWCDQLDPFWAAGEQCGDAVEYLHEHRYAVSDALLEVSDERAASATDQTARAVYARLRPNASSRVADHIRLVGEFVRVQVDAGPAAHDSPTSGE